MSEIVEFSELLEKQEDLEPELTPYIINAPELGWPILKHPLVFSIPYVPHMNALINYQFRHKKEQLAKSLLKKDWGQYIFLHERPYRFEAFANIADDMSDSAYWDHLGSIWIDSENLWQVQSLLDEFLSSNRPGGEKMMGNEERELLESLPDEFRIFRGHQRINKAGYSWTLSYAKACWFANRLQKDLSKSGVVTALCKKEDVIAILLGRGEYEVAIQPDNIKIEDVKPLKRSAKLEKIRLITVKQFKLPGSIHGIYHWDKVESNAIELCKIQKDADPVVCRIFGFVHDCKRESDGEDPLHGVRSAAYILNELHSSLYEIGLSSEQMAKLAFACKNHNNREVSKDATIGVCWDADRLDLSRVGVIPDSKLLSTKAAKELILRI